jgi:transcriptional regulator with XRE-family HTH domain
MISKRIKELREAKNLTIKATAGYLGVPPSTYREWEQGTKISGEPYEALAELFGVSLHYLMTGTYREPEYRVKTIVDQLAQIDRLSRELLTLKQNILQEL